MIGKKKTVLNKKSKWAKVWFRSFGEKERGEGHLRPAEYLNCDCREGILQGGIGIEPYYDKDGETVFTALNVPAYAVYFATVNAGSGADDLPYIYFLGIDGYLYQRNATTGAVVKQAYCGEYVDHCAIKGENGMIFNLFSGTKRVCMTTNGQSFRLLRSGDFRGSCVCGKRHLLVTEDGILYYSAPLMPYEGIGSDPHGSGLIYLPTGYGSAVGMQEYGGEAYIFFEKGIFRLTVAADASDFTLENIPYKGGNICLRAQATTGKGILFLAGDGAYHVRGKTVKRVCEHLPITPCETDFLCRVGYCDDLVIFSYSQKKADGADTKRLVLYADGEDGYLTEISGPLGGNGYLFLSQIIYSYVKDREGIRRNQTPYFTSERLDFGTKKKKTLKTLTIRGKGSVTVGVRRGETEREYTLTCEGGVAKTRLLGKGEEFVFTLRPSAGATVAEMEVEYTTEA